jgi:hypothetical protein
MFGFLFHRKREEVKRILHGRMNRTYMQGIENKNRSGSRGAFCEVVWLIPVDEDSRLPDFSGVATLVTKDISSTGLSLIHNQPVRERRVIVGLRDETLPRFIVCDLEHCTSLGYGHYLLGLHPDEVIQIEPRDVEAMEQRLSQIEEPVLA